MTTADWALVVSLGSLTIAIAAFVWNVWSKFIYPKPKLRVSFGIMHVFGAYDGTPPVLSISATNFGPVAIIVRMAVARTLPKGFRRKRQVGVLNPLHNYPLQTDHTIGPFSGGLPKKLEVGEEFSVYFPYDAKAEVVRMDQVGFSDTFGKFHWAPRSQVRQALEQFNHDYGQAPKQA